MDLPHCELVLFTYDSDNENKFEEQVAGNQHFNNVIKINRAKQFGSFQNDFTRNNRFKCNEKGPRIIKRNTFSRSGNRFGSFHILNNFKNYIKSKFNKNRYQRCNKAKVTSIQRRNWQGSGDSFFVDSEEDMLVDSKNYIKSKTKGFNAYSSNSLIIDDIYSECKMSKQEAYKQILTKEIVSKRNKSSDSAPQLVTRRNLKKDIEFHQDIIRETGESCSKSDKRETNNTLKKLAEQQSQYIDDWITENLKNCVAESIFSLNNNGKTTCSNNDKSQLHPTNLDKKNNTSNEIVLSTNTSANVSRVSSKNTYRTKRRAPEPPNTSIALSKTSKTPVTSSISTKKSKVVTKVELKPKKLSQDINNIQSDNSLSTYVNSVFDSMTNEEFISDIEEDTRTDIYSSETTKDRNLIKTVSQPIILQQLLNQPGSEVKGRVSTTSSKSTFQTHFTQIETSIVMSTDAQINKSNAKATAGQYCKCECDCTCSFETTPDEEIYKQTEVLSKPAKRDNKKKNDEALEAYIDRLNQIQSKERCNSAKSAVIDQIMQNDPSVLVKKLQTHQPFENTTQKLGKDVETCSSTPSKAQKITFYWVPKDYRHYLHASDQPIASEYFPNAAGKSKGETGNATFCAILVREFFHVNLYLRLSPDSSEEVFVVYSIIVWDEESKPVCHFSSEVSIPLLPGGAHHIGSLSDSASQRVLTQDYMVVVVYLTYFPQWSSTPETRPPLWWVANPPGGTKELGVTGGSPIEYVKLFQKREMTDMKVVCSGHSIDVHKVIVCSQSPIIRQKAKNSSSVTLPGFDSLLSARQFIFYFYTGHLGPQNMDWYDRHTSDTLPDLEATDANKSPLPERWVQILEQVAAGMRFEVPGLVRKAAAWLSGELTPENASLIFLVASKFCIVELKRRASKFIRGHLRAVKKTQGWKDMTMYAQTMGELLEDFVDAKCDKEKFTSADIDFHTEPLHNLTAFSHVPLLQKNYPDVFLKVLPPRYIHDDHEMNLLLETQREVGCPLFTDYEIPQAEHYHHASDPCAHHYAEDNYPHHCAEDYPDYPHEHPKHHHHS